MVELLIRPTGLDPALMSWFLAPLARRPAGTIVVRPRLVANAELVNRYPAFEVAARQAGIPFLVDPRTPLLQDVQYPSHRWAQLPFGDHGLLTPADLSPDRCVRLVEQAVEHQVNAGATKIIAPYLHINRADDGWLHRQRMLLRQTRVTLERHNIQLELIAIIDVWWRLLDRTSWPEVLHPLLREVAAAGCAEIGLAGSLVDDGSRPQDRVAALLAAIRRCGLVAPTLAWNQGRVGELCVAGGAAGYGTGIGWGERCNTPEFLRQQRVQPDPDAPRSARPVWIEKLGRGIPPRTIERLTDHRGIAPDLPCPAHTPCCPDGVQSLVRNDGRRHTLTARVRSLRELSQIEPVFRWRHLQDRAEAGLDLANRINALAEQRDYTRVDTAALRASIEVATHLRHRARRVA